MRLKLHCRLTSKENVLGYNYNRSLSALIYTLLSEHDPEYGKALHNANRIKGFTFSPLYFHDAQYRKEITLTDKKFSFVVSTSDEILVTALMNVSQRERVLVTKEGSIRFQMDSVEITKPVIRSNIFQLGSPLVISIDGENRTEYLPPSDENYKELLFKNLIKKAGKQVDDYNLKEFGFKVLTANPKEKLITHVKGYIFDFMIDCPEELVMAGVVNGFGIKNSQGFGYVK